MISIHALREEGDPGRPGLADGLQGFLSTPSARRATNNSYGVRPALMISIHALREEGDILKEDNILWTSNFYPRPPRGGRP